MAEATTVEETQLTDRQKEFLRQRWYVEMQKRGQDLNSQDTRSTIEKMVDMRIPPQDGEKRRERVQEFTNRKELDIYLNLFSQSRDAAEKDISKGQADPPGEILRTIKKSWTEEDWQEFGWENEKIRAVGSRLREVLNFDDNQIRNTLEILVSTGKTPDQLLDEINPEALAAIKTSSEAKGSVDDKDVNLAFLHSLGIKQDWIVRFIMPRDFADYNEQSFSGMPANIEELVWQMSHQSPNFRIGADFPILEMRIVKNATGGIDRQKSRFYVNQANMIHWVRAEMADHFDLSPDSAHNFFEKVHLKKQYSPLSITDMFLNDAKYFVSEDGELHYHELKRQLEIEVWIMTVLRQFDVEYKSIYNSEEKLPEKIQQLFYNSDITKHAYGKNMWYHLLTMPLDFTAPEKGKTIIGDNKLGAIINEMIMAYSNISDFEQLQQILGPNSSFFTRDGMWQAVGDLIAHQSQRIGTTTIESFLGQKDKDALLACFDKTTGRVTASTKDEFMKFINIFITQTPGAKTVPILRQVMKNAMLEKYGTWNAEKGKFELKNKDGKVDNMSMTMADYAAISWWRFTGMGAVNDTAFAGYDSISKVMNAEYYREKMIDRGMAHGNPYTIPQFKKMVVDFMRGVTTQASTDIKDERGRYVLDKEGKKKLTRNKTPYEVMMELQALSNARSAILRGLEGELHTSTGERRKQVEAEIANVNLQYQNCADQLTFRAEIMRDYASNHLDRGFKLYKLIMEAKEFHLDQFTQFDTLRGVTFDREKFQDAVQEKFLKPLRYLLQTYDELNYNMDVRMMVKDKKGKVHYETMKLGEALFGYQLLNRKMFWKVENGKYVKENGRHVIDYNKVNDPKGKIQLWKQWALMKIAADLHSHRALHSTDPNFNFTYYLNVIAALEAIPGAIWKDDANMQNLKVTKTFFSKKDLAWLRDISSTTNYNLYTKAILESIFWPKQDKEGTGIGDAFANFFKAISPGAQLY